MTARPRRPGAGETNLPPSTGYPTAYDIPPFRKMAEDLVGLRTALLIKRL